MNIIIVGAGEVGRHLAESLSGHNHNICVIETSEPLIEELEEQLDVHCLLGSGSSVTSLAEADVGECELFLAVTSDDNTNLVSASMAKSLGAKKTIARVRLGVQQEEWLFNYKDHFKIDYLFSSERLAAVELAKFVRNPEKDFVEELARGRIELQQTFVSPHSDVVETPIRELPFPKRVRIAFIQRFGENIIPDADETLQAGDLVTIFGEPHALQKALPLLHPADASEGSLKIVIFGGTEYGLALAQMFEGTEFKIRIIEEDRKRCEFLSTLLQNSVIINGNATSLQQLKEEQVGQADFFIAASGDDEDNVMTCLQAQTLGTRHCLALIQRADYADVISRSSEKLGILGAVSPRVATSRDLLRFVTSDKFYIVMTLAGGTEIIEAIVPEDGSVAGKKVSEIKFPSESGLVAIMHREEAFVPGGDDVIHGGDTVYAIVAASARKAMVKLITR